MSEVLTIPEIFIPVAKVRNRQIFYSIKDGNWNDPATWLSNKYGSIPGINDDVYINSVVIANVTTTVTNLFVSGTLKAVNNVHLTVLGNIQAVGSVDFTGSNIELVLYGWDNFINTFIKGNSTITYTNNYWQQVIMELNYHSLNLYDRGVKILNFDLILSGNFNVSNTDFDLGVYDLYVGGNTSFGGGMTLRKTGPGSITFIGNIFEPNYGNTFDFSGAPTIEMQGGWQVLAHLDTGAGLVSFTRSQLINSRGNSAVFTLENGVIYSGVTVRIACESYIGIINGNAPDAVLQIDRMDYASVGEFKKTVHYTGVIQPMKLGVLDCVTWDGAISYDRNGDQEIKGTTYSYLTLGGSGVKKLMGDVTVPAAKYSLTGSAVLDTNGFNFNLV